MQETLVQFQQKVREQIKRLSRKQQVYFAWLCGVKSLPFLCMGKRFNYWGERKQIHLKATFHSLDICAAIFHGESVSIEAANTAISEIKTAVDAARSDNVASVAASAVHHATSACIADVYAASNTHNTYDNSIYVGTPYIDAIVYAASAVVRAANNVNKSIGASIQKNIITDIESISNNNFSSIIGDIDVYGSIWRDFLNDLVDENCAYWANLYSDLFENKFHININSLRQRLNVIKEAGDGASDIAYFLTKSEAQGARHLNEARIVILGNECAGKTSLARKLLDINAELPEEEERTEGVDIMPWVLPEKNGDDGVNVHIWDFAGQVVTHAAHKFFLSERCIYIIVCDGRLGMDSRLDYWLDHVKNYGGNSPVYILVNKKTDYRASINENRLKDKYGTRDDGGIIKDVKYLSIQDDLMELERFRDELAEFIRQDPVWNKDIPALWYAMKEKLHKISLEEKYYLTITEFCEIAKNLGIGEEDFEPMRKPLHELGICLWYEKIAQLNTVIINPNWISYGIYKIINWLNKKEEHKLLLKNFPEIFSNEKDVSRYPKEKHDYLFNIMQTYELAYPIKNSEKESLIIPYLLPMDQPEQGIDKDFRVSDSLLMCCTSKTVLPIDTIARFIVRHHQDIQTNNNRQPIVWRDGVKLDSNGSQALVMEVDNEIRLYTKGTRAKEYFNELRSTLIHIFNSYKNSNPKFEYKITETAEHVPVFADDGTISAFYINGRLYIDAVTGREINMVQIKEKYGDTIIVKGNSNIVVDKSHVDAPISINPPPELTSEIFSCLLDQLSAFLQSEKAKDELRGRDKKELEAVIVTAKAEGDLKKRWSILRKAIAVSADIACVLSFALAANPAIPQVITNALTHL